MGIVLPEGILNNPSLGSVREFCEDRAFVRAVVSLPKETFVSAGATVKASLVFMQKFTVAEAASFAAVRAEAEAEVDAELAPQIKGETQRLRQEIKYAADSGEKKREKSLRAELKAYRKRMEEVRAREVRRLIKDRFDYDVFFFDAERVGITATGEQDACELFESEALGLPAGVGNEDTALYLFRKLVGWQHP